MNALSNRSVLVGRPAFQPRASSRRRVFQNPHSSRKILFRDLPRKEGFLMRSTPYIYSWTKRPLQPPAAPAGKIPLNQRLAVVFHADENRRIGAGSASALAWFFNGSFGRPPVTHSRNPVSGRSV